MAEAVAEGRAAVAARRLPHGGRLREAAARWGIPSAAWLDLSTGIHPRPWPVPEVPAEAWARLPEENDGLEAAARACYGARHVLAVAGTQAAIQALPQLRPPGRVAVLAPGYGEHARAWAAAGHEVAPVAAEALEAAAGWADAVVLAHPNNPTGVRFPRHILLDWWRRLARLLARHGLPPAGGTALFQWVPTPQAAHLHEALARRGILVRRFDDPPALRFGLPGGEAAWTRLAAALEEVACGS